MRKLLVFSVILAIAFFNVNNALSQDPGEIDSLAFGNPDGSPIQVNLNEDVDIQIWLKCDENLAFAHFCLATEDQFIQSRLFAYAESTFLHWDLLGTLPAQDWPSQGLTSQSILGIADFSLPQPNYINTNGEWLLVGGFRVHTTDNAQALGQTSQLFPGEDPLQGISVLFDEFWTPISPAMKFSSIEFQTTTTPHIITPPDDTVFIFNNRYSFSIPVEAVDADSESIALQVEFPYQGYDFTEIENIPGYASYLFTWTPPEDCDTIFEARFIATDTNLVSDTATVTFDIRPVTITVTSDSTLPGYDATVEVYLVQDGPNSNVGGFDLLFIYDPTIISYQDIEFGQELNSWEFLDVFPEPVGPGSLRLVGLANLNVGNVPPLRDGHHLLASITFLTVYDSLLQGIAVPLNMPVTNYSENVLADSAGYLVYHPFINEGYIAFLYSEFVLIGDTNQNQLPYETGDAVVFINHLLYPYVYPFNNYQRLVSDCNQDFIPETIADLIFMLNVINGGGDALSFGGADPGTADVSLNSNNDLVTMKIDSESQVGGLFVSIDHASVVIENVATYDGLELHYSDTGEHLYAVIYPAEINNPVGHYLLQFTITEGNAGDVVIDSYQVSDTHGRLMNQ